MVLLTHLLLMGVLPMAEVLHRHGRHADVELHNVDGDCEHEGHLAKCPILRIGSVSALPVPQASLALGVGASLAPLSLPTAVGLPDEPASPALPRAPPLG